MMGYLAYQMDQPDEQKPKGDTKIRVRERTRADYRPRPQQVMALINIGWWIAPPMPDTSFPLNMVSGMLKRLVRPPEIGSGIDFELRLRFIHFNIDFAFDTFQGVDYCDIVGSYTYIMTRPRDAKWKNKLLKVRERGPDYFHAVLSVLKEMLHDLIVTFVKNERLAVRKPARKIANVDANNLVNYGPLVLAAQSQLFGKTDEDGYHIFPKYIKHSERPEFILDKFEGTWGDMFEGDYSSWEQLQDITFQFVELVIMVVVAGPMWKPSYDILNEKVKNRQWDMLYFMAELEPIRLSGSPMTSFMNGYNNMVIHEFLMQEVVKATEWKYVLEGDDIVMAYNGDRRLTVDDYSALGLKMKMLYVDSINEASFCGLFFDDVDRVVIKDPWPVIIKSCWLSKQYVLASDETLLELQRAKAISLLYELGGCPVITAFACRVMELTNHISHDRLMKRIDAMQIDQYHKDELLEALLEMKDKPYLEENFPVGGRSRALMSEKFGVPVSQQIAAEKALRQFEIGVNKFPHVFGLSEWEDYAAECVSTILVEAKQQPMDQLLSSWTPSYDYDLLKRLDLQETVDHLSDFYKLY